MSDTYGEIPIPTVAPAVGAAVTDPALSLVAAFLTAVLNANGQTAWAAVSPAVTGLQSGTGTRAMPVVRFTATHDPELEVLTETSLPALFLYRTGSTSRPFWLAEDYRVTEDKWVLRWVIQPSDPKARKTRQPFANAVVKIIDRAIESQRDPVFVQAGDPDPTAPTTPAAPTAIKVAVTSSTSQQVYTGAALDGAIGGSAFAPSQIPTVTTTGSGGSGIVLFAGIGGDGNPRTSRVTLGGVGTFTGDWALSQITSITVPAQADDLATLAFGLFGFAGLGTNIIVLGALFKIEIIDWADKMLVIKMGDQSPPRTYDAVEISLEVTEHWIRDISSLTSAAVDTQYPTSGTDNADVREESLFT